MNTSMIAIRLLSCLVSTSTIRIVSGLGSRSTILVLLAGLNCRRRPLNQMVIVIITTTIMEET